MVMKPEMRDCVLGILQAPKSEAESPEARKPDLQVISPGK